MLNTKNFKAYEFECKCGCKQNEIKQELVNLLQRVSDYVGNKPILINSGYRCAAHNKAIGGKRNSAHLRGTAADIKCLTSGFRFELVNALFRCGFNRIGIYDTFIHADIDTELPANQIWTH